MEGKKNLLRPGRISLGKSALTAIETYHLTTLPLPKWATTKLNKIPHNFIWHEDDVENVSRGHSMAKRKTVC